MKYGKPKRISTTLNKLRTKGYVSVEELSLLYGVSKQQVRNDLEFLQDLGKCKKVRGGAIVSGPDGKKEKGIVGDTKDIVQQPREKIGKHKFRIVKENDGGQIQVYVDPKELELRKKIYKETRASLKKLKEKLFRNVSDIWISGDPIFPVLLTDSIVEIIPNDVFIYTNMTLALEPIRVRHNIDVIVAPGKAVGRGFAAKTTGSFVTDWLERLPSIDVVFMEVVFVGNGKNSPFIGFRDDDEYEVAKVIFEKIETKNIILYSLPGVFEIRKPQKTITVDRDCSFLIPIYKDDVKGKESYKSLYLRNDNSITIETKRKGVRSIEEGINKRNSETPDNDIERNIDIV